MNLGTTHFNRDDLDIKYFTREANASVEEYKKILNGSDIKFTHEEISEFKANEVKKKVAGAIASIAETLNGGDKKDVVAGMLLGLRMTHRYIQSEFWQGMIQLITETSKLDKMANFDGRNDWTREACERMAVAAWNPDAVNMEKQ